MKQVIQSFKTGELTVDNVPTPFVRRGGVLIHTNSSLVSAGTERMLVDFAEKNLIEKARSRPDLVRQAVEKAQREGVMTTIDAVRNRLDQPIGLGYCCAGTIIDVAEGVSEFQIGDRVACGGEHASHAEVVAVPKNLVVHVPDGVDFESAAFTTLGAIALQGIRLAEVRLGECVAVIGLGLLGQMTVQMLKAAGCIVVGMDIQPQRAELARQLGANAVCTSADDLSTLCGQFTAGHGADAVLITADTKSNQPVETAGLVARNKGVVVAVGAVGMTIPRKVYYEKELDFRISRSYGPGRYDPAYEEQGHDYPYGYVRWTEQRNMQAFVQLLSEGKVDVQSLITHRFQIDTARQAYDLIGGKTDERFLGVVLKYPETPDLRRKVVLRSEVGPVHDTGRQHHVVAGVDRLRLGVIGAGNFANGTLLPAVKGLPGIDLVGVASGGGVSARTTAARYGFAYCSTDIQVVLSDPAINTVAILTRHHLHARQVVAALEAGKHVFVEKPLCLNHDELRSIVDTVQAVEQQRSTHPPLLMVGFNRRFAPFVVELKQHLQRVNEPLMMHYRINAGYIPPEHWVQDPAQGGGRLLGEACHFIDLLVHLSGGMVKTVTTRALPDSGRYSQDNLSIMLEFTNGSIGIVTYLANGDVGLGKESLEVFGGGLSARLDNYRTLQIRSAGAKVDRVARLRQDKGHRAEWQALAAYLAGKGAVPISFEDIVHSTHVTLDAQHSFDMGEPVAVMSQSALAE